MDSYGTRQAFRFLLRCFPTIPTHLKCPSLAAAIGFLNPSFRRSISSSSSHRPLMSSSASSVPFDDQRTRSLLQYMNEKGAIRSAENELKMKDAIEKLKQVHGLESDIDALCIGPSYATMAYEDILDPFFIEKLDETMQRSLSAVRTNMHIRRLVPNLESFGYFGGIHLAILAAYVCQKYPKGIGRPYFDWRGLFNPFPYTKNCKYFVRIFLAASDDDQLWDWMGWVKSRFRSLIIKLERKFGFCDPNPTEYTDHETVDSHTVFYWGLSHVDGSADIFSIKQEFMLILANGYQVSCCELELSIVDLYQLPATVLFACGGGKESKACWRILDYCEWREPVYTQHVPEYFVGHVETDCRFLSADVKDTA